MAHYVYDDRDGIDAAVVKKQVLKLAKEMPETNTCDELTSSSSSSGSSSQE